MIDDLITKSTAVDGVTGEKGLAGYSAFVIQSMAACLGDFERMQPGFLEGILQRHPVLHQTYRFHIDTWCLQRYYPRVGDTLWFAMESPRYEGVRFAHAWSEKAAYKAWKLEPSPYSFLWSLQRATGDPAFAQIIYIANGNSIENLPYDLFTDDPEKMQSGLRAVIDKHGTDLALSSVNKTQWHLAILRSGKDPHARASWMSYGVEENHRHQDGMNLGLFARGLDLLPDFGYPPVQFGGWNNARADWYRNTHSHNTVVVDGKNHAEAGGETTLWNDTAPFQVIQTSGPEMIDGGRFERTVVMVDVSDSDFYLLDVFRVAGGHDHAKFMHSHFGTLTPTGLNLEAGEDYGYGTFMRDFRVDRSPAPGWFVDWDIEDRLGYLPENTEVHLRYTDLTRDAEAHLCEAWIATGNYQSTNDTWIPRVMVRRKNAEAELESTFVSIIEAYGAKSCIARIRRLSVTDVAGKELSDAFAAVEITLTDGRCDLIVSSDVPSGGEAPRLTVQDWDLETDAALCVVRKDKAGNPKDAIICKGSYVSVGDWRRDA
jgi:hypothetical protein